MELEFTAARRAIAGTSLLVCFSHLRWNFVFQRPQHLLTRAARSYQVLYFEEPVRENIEAPCLRTTAVSPSLHVLTPVLPHRYDAEEAIDAQRALVDTAISSYQHDLLVFWYYTPMALPFSGHLKPDVCVYDCMDELSAFKGAPPELAACEQQLFKCADLVFTGGQSLYEAKRRQHRAIYPFPSSIDVAHFRQARAPGADPVDQTRIPHPRVGFFGVIDERLDVELVAQAASAMPDVQFVMLGPVVKIDPSSLPKASNIHWLGQKSYDELPAYLGHWDAGWMPFALNQSTRYISPTKTPEFLAAGLPVVSTAIVDVVRTYAAEGLVEIADSSDIVEKLQQALAGRSDAFLMSVDARLAQTSWDQTWYGMAAHMARAGANYNVVPARRLPAMSAGHV